MTKKEEFANPASCLNKASENEMLFVLLERDPAAPAAIRAWVEERIRLGKNRDLNDSVQLAEAKETANNMAQTSKPAPKITVTQKSAMSVWAVWGNPQGVNGLGACRSGMYLMPMETEPDEAARRFIKECSKQDAVDYNAAKLQEIRYIGWVWLPEHSLATTTR
jgi:hypothetical protein